MLDTNVLVSALGWDGPERRLYRACLAGALQPCTSMPLLEELIQVMRYPKLGFSVHDQETMIELSPEEIAAYAVGQLQALDPAFSVDLVELEEAAPSLKEAIKREGIPL